jgi:hypothetical protein
MNLAVEGSRCDGIAVELCDVTVVVTVGAGI